MQDETQRLEQQPPPQRSEAATPRPPPQRPETPPPSPAPATAPPGPATGQPPAAEARPPQPQSPTPAVEGAASPRGLEGLRVEREVPRDYSLEYGQAEHVEPLYLPMALSVGAGFKFGCGFMLAVAISGLALFLVFSVVFFVASLVGVPFPIGAAQ